MNYSTKKYVTTVTTEWELRGNVTPEQINERIQIALGGIMMTKEEGGDYAFTGSRHLRECETKVMSDLTEDQKTELWGILEDQGAGMDHGSLAQYYADNEQDKYDSEGLEELKQNIR